MYDFLKTLALPPFNLIAAMAIGLAVASTNQRRLGQCIVGSCLVFLFLLSTGQVGDRLMRFVESEPVLTQDELMETGAQAIVILGATVDATMAEFGSAKADDLSLIRLRYGAFVHEKTGLPILISGGSLRDKQFTVSQVLADDLEASFGVKATWLEKKSSNTFENAVYSAELLLGSNVSRVILVTQAFHMPRAVIVFRAAGLEVVPAPTGFTRKPSGMLSFLPTARGLTNSYYALHELLGRIWYSLKMA